MIDYISVCCYATPLFDVNTGICSSCLDHTTFDEEDEDE